MPLHPDLEAFLELVNDATADGPALHEMTPAQARAAYDRSTLALDEPGADLPTEALALPARDGHVLPARLYRGGTEPRPPVLLFFHGGGYVLGGLESHDSLCRDLAARAACAVLAVDYRRAPEHRFPTAFHDAEDTFGWLRGHAGTLGLDPGRIAVGGDSVGGTLATALTLAAREAGLPQPVLQLLLYPCTSARQDTPSHQRLASGFLLEARNLQWMFGQYLRDDADRLDWRFAPLQAARLQDLAPAHLALAEFDPLLDEGLAYAEALRAAGVRATSKVYPGMVHDFARIGNVVEEAGSLRAELAAVLAQAFR
ncbi:alpha/beta hydrolase [Roseateles chitinivorans]|uniref:alpha/beta hydrolase n=1 Tax=Roseateles chitinivorans TaxID=2917965 RepID=UPI003D67B8E6